MNITFTIADLDQALKDRDPNLNDSASFATRRTSAAKQALSSYYETLRASNDVWARGSTLNGAAVSTGSEVINTSIGDVYRIALATGQYSIAGDTIFLYKSTTPFITVPRSSIEAILTSGTPTTEVFWENHGELILYSKDGDFTSAGSLHFDFWRDPAIDTTTSTNVIDVRPQDFTQFVDSVFSLMAAS